MLFRSETDSAPVAAKYSAEDIVGVRLEISTDGHGGSEHWRRTIDVTAERTRLERTVDGIVRSPVEWETSTFEWPRLCQLVIDTQLFGVAGLAHVYNPGSRHMEVARVMVSFADGTESSVGDGAFHVHGKPPFWTLVRAIEGGTLGEALDRLELASR